MSIILSLASTCSAILLRMKLLDVPHHLQDLGSKDCGPITSLMVLDYYHVPSSVSEVLRRVPRTSGGGTSIFDNANMLRDYGLEVEAITAQPLLFNGDFIRSKPSPEQIRKQAASVDKANPGHRTLISLLEYMDKGGALTLAIPSEQQIIDAINPDLGLNVAFES